MTMAARHDRSVVMLSDGMAAHALSMQEADIERTFLPGPLPPSRPLPPAAPLPPAEPDGSASINDGDPVLSTAS